MSADPWKMVPVEPTKEMWLAGADALLVSPPGSKTNKVYAAMLSAAPPAPAGAGDGMTDEEIDAIARKHTYRYHGLDYRDFARAIIAATKEKT